ncbi:TonB-dependent receptor [Stenotrophomonas sp. HITSZ_GD]|uniref:TonB-dependent receptor n=1 Tax=Stenotrophomonas sp. HITSZ_GD TaxID=3037248 RepID=UPI00240D0861|nr:TonB-dependent receptor [Stenotrophomonas sp. HITSZ_GD]MDG2526550.1 TonB-dependent receptor [Stenotrophomonas sp. HITSZ_GD]
MRIAPLSPRGTVRRHHLVLACALALSAGTAQAQQATAQNTPDPTTLDAVQVTGIRAAIESAVATKNESTSIVEAISAEDIGKLPDISIADSISRLPGIATQRVDGRSQVVQIRGMSEQFVGTTLNGREQVSTGESRGVEFDQYPAELINAVTVYKTADAAVVGQGLSGTVDLQTIRPLDLGERRIVITGNGEKNSLGKLSSDGDDKGYRASASYVDQFADDTIGIALGVARLNSPFQEQHYKEWWWANTDVWGQSQPGKPADAIALQGQEAWVKSRDLTRDGVMGAFEFKPNEHFHSILDVYWSKFQQDEVMHGAMWTNDAYWTGMNGQPAGYQNIGLTERNGYPIITSGTQTGVQPLVRNDNNTREDKLFSAGWTNTLSFDPWTVSLDLNYSRAERRQSQLETYAGLADPQDVGFQVPISAGYGHYSLADLSDPNSVYLWDVQNYGHDGRLENSWQKDEIKAGRLQFTYDVDTAFVRSFDFGANINRRSKDKRSDVYFATLRDGPTLVDPSLLMSPTSLGFVGMGNLLTFNPRALLDRYYDVAISESNDDLRKDYVVDEDVNTYYLRANIDMDLTDRVRVRGNAGMQYITTDQSSTGFNANGGAITGSQTLGARYHDALPSLNLVFDFGDGWNVRFGAAKQLMRAPINYLSADSSASVSQTTSLWEGSGGNPTLEPYRANAVDLSLEKYMGRASYASLALFYKDLETYIYRQTIPWDFTGYNPDGEAPISNIGTFSTWANGTGGYMRGVEAAVTLTGDLFSERLDGFGVQLNGSYTESSIDPDPNDATPGTDTIPGLSKVVANATLFYEKYGWGARISQRYRDPYRGEYSSLFGQRQYRNTLSERSVDLQVSYAFPDTSVLKGLSVMFQVNNLTNEPFRTEVSESTNSTGLFLPEEYTEYGRQYLLGFSYKL